MVEYHKGIKQIGIAYDSGCLVIDWMRERERERERVNEFTDLLKRSVFMRVSCPWLS